MEPSSSTLLACNAQSGGTLRSLTPDSHRITGRWAWTSGCLARQRSDYNTACQETNTQARPRPPAPCTPATTKPQTSHSMNRIAAAHLALCSPAQHPGTSTSSPVSLQRDSQCNFGTIDRDPARHITDRAGNSAVHSATVTETGVSGNRHNTEQERWVYKSANLYVVVVQFTLPVDVQDTSQPPSDNG